MLDVAASTAAAPRTVPVAAPRRGTRARRNRRAGMRWGGSKRSALALRRVRSSLSRLISGSLFRVVVSVSPWLAPRASAPPHPRCPWRLRSGAPTGPRRSGVRRRFFASAADARARRGVRLSVKVGRVHHGCLTRRALPLEVAALDLGVPEVTAGVIDNSGPHVSGDSRGVADVLPLPRHANKRLMSEVLGESPVTGDEEGKPRGARHLLGVQPREPCVGAPEDQTSATAAPCSMVPMS